MVRKGKLEDLPILLDLIKELARLERAEDQVENTVEKMQEQGFGNHPCFNFFVAQDGDQVVAAAVCYFRYSTWKGKRLYLEDLIVTETHRGQGYGEKLLKRTMQYAHESGCSGLVWQVLDWNQPAIEFYKKKFNATLDGEWINCSVDEKAIESYIKQD